MDDLPDVSVIKTIGLVAELLLATVVLGIFLIIHPGDLTSQSIINLMTQVITVLVGGIVGLRILDTAKDVLITRGEQKSQQVAKQADTRVEIAKAVSPSVNGNGVQKEAA